MTADIVFFDQIGTTSARVFQTKTFDYIGDFNADRITEIAIEFLKKYTSGDGNYEQYIRKFLQLYQSPSVWFTIRLSHPTGAWVVPRWHRDGKMFHTGASVKYAVTLQGAPTRAIYETPEITEIMLGGNYETRRDELAEKLLTAVKIPISVGIPFKFTCGEPNSLIHSEPDITSDRIFMSGVPGSEQQIRELAQIRKREYGAAYAC